MALTTREFLEEAIRRIEHREDAPGTSIEEGRGLAIAVEIIYILMDEIEPETPLEKGGAPCP